MKSLDHSLVSYMLLISCAIRLRPMFFQQFEYIPRYIIVINCSLLIPYVLDNFSPSPVQDVRAFLVFNYLGSTSRYLVY